jgi:OmpA-OmpF porin, OOP family
MKCLRFLAAVAAMVFAGSAAAQLYVFAGAGAGNPKFDEEDFGFPGVPRRADSTDTSYHLGIGYRLTRNWAAEVGYADLGNYSIYHEDFLGNWLDQRWEAKGWKVAGLGIYPFTDRFSIYGKLGVAATKVKSDFVFNVGGTITAGTGEKRRTSMLAGFGAQYNIFRHLAVRAEYESWGEIGNEADTGRAKMGTWNVLGVFSF